MKPSRLHLFLGLLSLLWVAGVFALYYAWHKPFTMEFVRGAGGAVCNLLAALALISLAGGLGRWLLGEVDLSPLVGLALQCGLGLGLLSTAVLFVGSTLGIHWIAAWAALVLPGFLLRKQILAWWRAWREVATAWDKSSGMGKALGILTGLLLSFTLLLALAPPGKFDTLVYHLSLPASYIQAGKINYAPWNFFWGMPQLAEMLNVWSMLIAGESAATCLGWIVGVIALVGLFGFLLGRFGAETAWIGVASLLAGYTTVSALYWGYVEWYLILYGLAFLVALQSWLDSSKYRWLVMAGVFSGFALGSKYTAGSLLVAGLVIVTWHRLRKSDPRRALLDAVQFLAAGAMVASPWLLKNLVATGNPVYPFLFPAGEVDAYRLRLYQDLSVWGDWREVVFLPLRATFLGIEAAPGYAASMGPLLLGLGLIYPLRRLLRMAPELPKAGAAASLAFLAWIIWGLASRTSGLLVQTRLYAGFFPAFAVLASGGYRLISTLRIPGLRLSRVAGSLVVLAMSLNAIHIGSDLAMKRAVPFLLGMETRESYLSTNLGWYYPAMQAIRDLPGEPQVLMLWEPRSLYCLPRCDPDEVLDRWLVETQAHPTAGEIIASWRRAGYSHVMVNQTGADFVRQDDRRYSTQQWQMLDDLLANLSPSKQIGGGYSLYSLSP